VVTGSGSNSNTSDITGGNGGNGGISNNGGSGGGGGTGGVGVLFSGSAATFTNSGTIVGGNGGIGGTTNNGGIFGSNGAGGAGIVGTGLTIINNGTISGGLSGDGVTRANAITFTGGTNVLELQAGYNITGNVVAFSAADTLRLGGTSNASFDVSVIATQYQNFGIFQKTGSSSWTLTGTTTAVTPWAINAGTLMVNGSIANSAVTVNSGGTLAGTGTVGATTINSGGTFAPGNSPGTMTVTGNLAFQSGALYVVQVNPATASNTNVSGSASLAGTVGAIFAPGTYMVRSYPILTAGGGLTGTFNALATLGLPPDFQTSVSYTANTALLNLRAQLVPEPTPPTPSPPIPPVPGLPPLPEQPSAQPLPIFTVNQLNVGHAIDNFFNNGGALPPTFVSLFPHRQQSHHSPGPVIRRSRDRRAEGRLPAHRPVPQSDA
jgi:uncharacterized protein with beta-barrel porin domain